MYLSLSTQARKMPQRTKPWRIEVKPDNDGAPIPIKDVDAA
jgi:hypothetical protein